jgi:cytochrome c553
MYRELVAYKQGRRSDESMIAAAKFLSEDAFVKVSAYYASLELSARAGRETAQGGDGSEADDAAAGDPLAAARAAAACAGCHGEDGNSAVPGMPNLTAQHPEYLADATRAYGDSRRKDDIMKSIIASFGDETIAAVSLYFALQQPRGTGAAITGDVAAGRKAAEACSGCHGADGNATAPDTPSLAGQDPTYAAKALKAYRDGGRDHPGMSPAAAELSDTDVDALVAFYATQPPVARDVPKPLSVTEWVQRCDRCHGHDGNSTDPRFPSLAGQKGVYLLRVLQEYQSGIRKSEMMHKMSEALRPSDLNLIAGYYAAKRRKSVIYVAVPGQ